MSNRITNADLESLCEWINELHGIPNEPWSDERNERGGLVANAGVHYISGAYGGVRLEKMCKDGGSTDVLNTGYGTKRELYNAMHNYIRGFRAAKEAS